MGIVELPGDDQQRETASAAMEQFEQAYKLSDELDRDAMLPYLGKVAFAGGETEKAKKYANMMLDETGANKDWNSGNKIHSGHLLLGQIALAEGNVDQAKERLLKAARTKGSPQLNSFGPNMQLAKALLEEGETEAVLECFELCRDFWSMGEKQLDAWETAVAAGDVPDFGANLRY